VGRRQGARPAALVGRAARVARRPRPRAMVSTPRHLSARRACRGRRCVRDRGAESATWRPVDAWAVTVSAASIRPGAPRPPPPLRARATSTATASSARHGLPCRTRPRGSTPPRPADAHAAGSPRRPASPRSRRRARPTAHPVTCGSLSDQLAWPPFSSPIAQLEQYRLNSLLLSGCRNLARLHLRESHWCLDLHERRKMAGCGA
jgi:hypothetical protein